MMRQRPDFKWHVAAPPGLLDELPQSNHLDALPVGADRSPIHLLKWYEFDLASTAARWRADAVFSITNYLPFRRLSLPTLLLEQHAGHFSDEFNRLMRG